MEANSSRSRAPRFRIGQHVRVIGPSIDRDRQGIVSEIAEGRLDYVHRYKIAFSDGKSKTFFGFELELIQSDSA